MLYGLYVSVRDGWNTCRDMKHIFLPLFLLPLYLCLYGRFLWLLGLHVIELPNAAPAPAPPVQAVPLLSAAFFLLIAVLFFFGVAAVQCFTNVFHNICAMNVSGFANMDSLGSSYAGYGSWLYEDGGDDPDMFGCSTPTKEGWWWRECPANYTCYVSVCIAIQQPIIEAQQSLLLIMSTCHSPPSSCNQFFCLYRVMNIIPLPFQIRLWKHQSFGYAEPPLPHWIHPRCLRTARP